MLWFIALCYNILATRMAEITSIPPFDPFEQTDSVGPAETDGKHDYSITSMSVELLLTIANKLCYFTLPGRLFKKASLPYHTLGPLTWRRLLCWTRTSLLRRAYRSKDKPFARLIERQMNQLLNTSHDYADWASNVTSTNTRSTRLLS